MQHRFSASPQAVWDVYSDHARWSEWAGTPGLARIPFLGSLFRHQRDVSRKSELVILLRAIAVGPDSWRQTLEETRDRVERLERYRLPPEPN